MLPLIQILDLIADDYNGGDNYVCLRRYRSRFVDWAIYRLQETNVLICQGSADLADWFFNIDVAPVMLPKQGATSRYAGGFLHEAEQVYDAARQGGPNIDIVAGHSRGAAVAAIVGASLKRYTVAVACPRYLWRWDDDHPNAGRVTHLISRWDPVTYVPLLLYRRYRTATTVRLDARGHAIEHYIEAARRKWRPENRTDAK